MINEYFRVSSIQANTYKSVIVDELRAIGERNFEPTQWAA